MEGTKFLTGRNYGRSIREVSMTGSELDVAVSYWTEDIMRLHQLLDTARLTSGPRMRVICDLFHRACHWAPVEELRDCNVEVRRLQGLHAKVWICESHVIIGSANSSNSALHLTQSDRRNEEAGVKLDNASVIEDARRWFGKIWGLATPVTDQDIDWKKENHPNPENGGGSGAGHSHDDQSDEMHTFEELVGESAARNYREVLESLGFDYAGRPGNLRKQFDNIENANVFSAELVDAIQLLVVEACGAGSFGDEILVPPGFLEPSGFAKRVLHERIANLVVGLQHRNLKLVQGEAQNELTYSLRLSSKRTGMKSVAVLTLLGRWIEACQDRPASIIE